jgi:hypothetical protein
MPTSFFCYSTFASCALAGLTACGGTVNSSSGCTMDASPADGSVNPDASDTSVGSEGAPDVEDEALDVSVPVDTAEASSFDPCSVGPTFLTAPSPQFVPKSGVACQKNVILAGVGLDCPGIDVRFGDTPAMVLRAAGLPPSPHFPWPIQAVRVQVPLLSQDAGPQQVQITVTAPSGLSQRSTEYFTYTGTSSDCTCIDSVDAGVDAGGCW